MKNWIYLDNRLPEDGDEEYYPTVIILLKNGQIIPGYYRSENQTWYGDYDNGQYLDITEFVEAWQPLYGYDSKYNKLVNAQNKLKEKIESYKNNSFKTGLYTHEELIKILEEFIVED